jgi:hypothetical protein
LAALSQRLSQGLDMEFPHLQEDSVAASPSGTLEAAP